MNDYTLVNVLACRTLKKTGERFTLSPVSSLIRYFSILYLKIFLSVFNADAIDCATARKEQSSISAILL